MRLRLASWLLGPLPNRRHLLCKSGGVPHRTPVGYCCSVRKTSPAVSGPETRAHCRNVGTGSPQSLKNSGTWRTVRYSPVEATVTKPQAIGNRKNHTRRRQPEQRSPSVDWPTTVPKCTAAKAKINAVRNLG